MDFVSVEHSLDTLETPALVVDLDVMERNLGRAAEYAERHGLALRPHVQTHKASRIAARQVALGAVGVTCATPHEAEVMARVTDDILVAFPPVGAPRAERLAALPSDVRLMVALDSEQAVEDIARAPSDPRRNVRGLVEPHLGMRRLGG